jgi:hypothetical protein
MPLIDFKTDLKSLRYGSDKPNGGSSSQPYIQSPIPGSYNSNLSNEAAAMFNSYYETNRTSLDFPIRGGRIIEVGGNIYSTPSNDIDRMRIQNFLKDSPRGTTFIQKQRGLQLTNPNTQVPNTIQNVGGLFNVDNQVIPVTRTYNPANTIAQVAAQGTGAHFNRHGNSPTLYESPQTTYGYIVANNNTPSKNRLTILAYLKLRDGGNAQFKVDDILNGGLSLQSVNSLGIAVAQNQILNYQGGPGSNYGIGSTIIRRATSTVPAKVYSQAAFTYEQIADQDTRQGNDPNKVSIQDFRAQLESSVVARSDYFYYSMESRLNIGNPGENSYPRIVYNSIIPPAVDKLNALDYFYYDSEKNTPWIAGGEDTGDIIKFAFECMSNDVSTNAIGLVFRAFLDGSIQDTNTAEFSSFKYLGRGETFKTYQGFTRDISFAFKILVQSRSEMRPLYRKLNHLISQVYPDYSPVSNFMRGNVVKLTIGDYLYRVPGFLNNVNVTLNTDVGWEIALNEYDDNDVRQAPFVVNISCGFSPILDILPRRENFANPYIPLIMNDGFLAGNVESDQTTTVRTPLQQQENVQQERRAITTPPAPTTFTGGGPQALPPVKTNTGGGNKNQARKSNPKATTPKTQTPQFGTYKFVQPKVIQDNTNVQIRDSNGNIIRGGRGATGG